MKIKFIILFISFLFFSTTLLMGQAVNYFPQPGFRWHYNTQFINTADSVLSDMDIIDSLGVQTIVDDSSCYPILSVNPFPVPPTANYYVALSGSEALVKMSLLPVPLDTIFSAPSSWFTLFKFQSGVVAPWTIFEWDTTVTIDSVTLPMGVKVSGKKVSLNEDVTVQAGTFSSARFTILEQVGVYVPYIGFTPLFTLADTFWVAQNTWIVKHTRDAVSFSYQTISFDIPGERMELISMTAPLGVHERDALPQTFSLEQNYPNPFNPSSVISYTLSVNSFVTLKVFNMLGQEVATLVDGRQEAGLKSVVWDASSMPSGVYVYRLQAGSLTEQRKMVLLR